MYSNIVIIYIANITSICFENCLFHCLVIFSDCSISRAVLSLFLFFIRSKQHLTSGRLICDLPSAAYLLHNTKLSYKYEQYNYTYFHYRAACRRATSNNAKIKFRQCRNARVRGRRNLNVDYPQVRLETLGRCGWPTRENDRGYIIVTYFCLFVNSGDRTLHSSETYNRSVGVDDIGRMMDDNELSSSIEDTYFNVIAFCCHTSFFAIFRFPCLTSNNDIFESKI